MEKYICDICGWIYDSMEGWIEEGIESGTSFEDLPDDFICPECGAGKDEFSPEKNKRNNIMKKELNKSWLLKS